MTLSILEDIWKKSPDGFKAGVSFNQWLADQFFILRNAIEKTLEENRHLADGEKCTLWRLKQAIGGRAHYMGA